MKAIHLANTDFEFELAKSECISLEQAWARHLLCLQLQFLPILYAQAEEAIAVTALPDSNFIHHLLNINLWNKENLPTFMALDNPHSFPGVPCYSWGFSKRVAQWAKSKKLAYSMPAWQIVKEVNSKAFSFLHAPSVPNSSLLYNAQDLSLWHKTSHGKRVLKTCFGLSGRGHRLIDNTTSLESIQAFCEKEWQQELPVIAEPWLDRFFDFSTQWNLNIDGKIQFVGSTIFETDAQGTYRGTLAGPEPLLFKAYRFFLEEHKQFIYPVLEKILHLGFFGFLGVDAFLYRTSDQQIRLYPLVEINGRQTMSLAALRFQRRWFPEQIIHLSFALPNEKIALLPTHIKKGHKEIIAPKTLGFSILA